MDAGRNLDSLIEKKVFDHQTLWRYELEMGGYDVFVVHDDGGDGTALGECPRYSTNIAAAWQVVECLLGEYSYYIKIYYDSVNWVIELTHADTGDRIVRSDVSAPYAICLAALKAVGYEVQE